MVAEHTNEHQVVVYGKRPMGRSASSPTVNAPNPSEMPEGSALVTPHFTEVPRCPYHDDVICHLCLAKHGIKVLNVAGNRESTNPGIFDSTFKFLVAAFGHNAKDVEAFR